MLYQPPHPQGHEDFSAEVDNIRSYGIKGPILHSSVDSERIGFIMGLQTNDSLGHITDLITKMNAAPHPIVVNMAGGLQHNFCQLCYCIVINVLVYVLVIVFVIVFVFVFIVFFFVFIYVFVLVFVLVLVLVFFVFAFFLVIVLV